MMLPVLLAVGAGVNLIAWHQAHINVNLIYSFDLRTALDFRQYLEIPAFFFCTLSYCLWLSFTVVSDTISPQVWPLVWLFTTMAILFNPLPVFHKSARWWLIRTTARVLSAGAATVEVSGIDVWRRCCRTDATSLYSSGTSGSETSSAVSTTPACPWAFSSARTGTILRLAWV